jgi:hypothetical protein
MAELTFQSETGQPASEGFSDVERADRLIFLAKDANRREDKDLEGYALRVASLIDWLASLGFMPPQLPPQLVKIMRDQEMLEVASPDELLPPDEGE